MMPARSKGTNRSKSKKRETRKRKAQRILIVEGGKNNKTESNYFRMIKQNISFPSWILKIDSASGNTSLQQMYNRAATLAGASTFDSEDRVFILFDADDHTRWKEKADFVKKHETEQILFIASNPCFELWILYHFENCRGFCTNKDLIKRVRKHLPDYEKNCDFSASSISSLFKDNLESAIDRSRQSDLNVFAGTGTQVYKIFLPV